VKEVADCLAWSGARPVEWLLDHAPVDPRWCLVHATHMAVVEAARLTESGAVAGLCPITEANLGDGVFSFEGYGGPYGIGSDSNILIDATEELRLLEYGQRLVRRGRNLLSVAGTSTGGTIYRAAVAGGARALGAADGLRTGASADFVTPDMDHVSLHGRRGDAILDGLIFAAGRSAIDGVWRRGRQLVVKGRHINRDPIAARYRATMEELLS